MEIKDYLQILGRNLKVLVLVPLLATVLVVGYLVAQPVTYEATATVTPTALVGGASQNQYSGANGLKAFVGNFSAAVTSPPIIQEVSAQTREPRGKIRLGLSAQQVGDSSIMQVTYRTDNRRQAEPVARAVASSTILFLFRTQVTLAQRSADAAAQSVDEAQATLSDMTAQAGLLPDKTYQVRADTVARLQEEQAQAQARGETTTAARLQTTINAKQAELKDLARDVHTYQTALDKKNQAMSTWNQAQQTLQQATAQFNAADPAQVVTTGRTTAVPILPQAAQSGAVAFGAGLFLAVGIVVLLEVVLPERVRVTDPFGAAPSRA